jgi:hypothetical protein
LHDPESVLVILGEVKNLHVAFLKVNSTKVLHVICASGHGFNRAANVSKNGFFRSAEGPSGGAKRRSAG